MAHHVVLMEVVVDMAGTDWKSALATLGGSSEENESKEKKEVDRKKRVGVVYSTNPNYGYSKDAEDESATLPKNQQKLRLNMERAGRGGKTVTLIKGFVGSDDDIRWVLIISFFELFVPPEPFMWNTTHFIYCKFNINLS
jgi:translation initiation factor 1 (eIF-1/SUI1)